MANTNEDGVDFQGPFSADTMTSIKEYARTSFETAKVYISDLHGFVLGPINTTPPYITLDPVTPVVIDQGLRSYLPTAPTSYPTPPPEPATQTFPFPTKPEYVLPVAPTLTDIVIPDFVEGTIREISTSIPSIDFDVPGIAGISTSDVPFDSLMQVIRDRLSSNILNGGTMLNPAVEADIWNRDLERNEQTLQDTLDKVISQWAKMGFSLPDGLLAGNLLAINNEYANKRLDRSREIAVKQAEMEHTGLFKSIELGIDLEKVIVGSGNEFAKRVLDAAKITADVTIELYKQRVVQFNAMLERYKADVLGYKTSIEAEMVRAEVYKARISGVQSIVEIDQSRVKLYSAHIEAINQLVNVYQTEVKSVGIMYEAERTKIEGFKSLVEAYTSKVNAITSKYLAEVDGYKGYVAAWSASADSQAKQKDTKVRADIAKLEATLKSWEVQLRLIQEATGVKLEALKTVAQTSSNLAAGALSAMHASVSDSYGESLSESHSYSY